MDRKPANGVPEAPGIDLQFRPRSYFWPLGLEKHLLARIKGAERKAALKEFIDANLLDAIPDFLAQSALSDDERQALGRIHPAFMRGEYCRICFRRRWRSCRVVQNFERDAHAASR